GTHGVGDHDGDVGTHDREGDADPAQPAVEEVGTDEAGGAQTHRRQVLVHPTPLLITERNRCVRDRGNVGVLHLSSLLATTRRARSGDPRRLPAAWSVSDYRAVVI